MIIRLHKDDATRAIGTIPSFDGDFIEDSDQSLQQEFSDLLDRAAQHFSSTNQSDTTTLALTAASITSPVAQRVVEAPKREARALESEGDVALQRAPLLAAEQPKEAVQDSGLASNKEDGRNDQQVSQPDEGVQAKALSTDKTTNQASSDPEQTKTLVEQDSSEQRQASQLVEVTETIDAAADQAIALAAVPQFTELKEDSVSTEEAPLPLDDVPAAANEQVPTDLTAPGPVKVDSSREADAIGQENKLSSSAGQEKVVDAGAQSEALVAPPPTAAVEVAETTFTRPVQQQVELPEVAEVSQAPVVPQPQAAIAPTIDLQALARRPDAAVQMSLLRQAFEGIKSSTADLKAGITGIQTPNVSGISAPAEARANQGETSQKSSPKQPLTRLAALRTLERVDSALREAARSRDGKTLSFRLDPPQLGQVKVDVTMREGGLHARLTPENQQVTVLVREHAHELQASLRKLGLNVETVTVSIGSEWSNGGAEGGEFASDGKSFQEGRNKLPGEEGQVAETTLGNELALTNSSALGGDNDHWVA